MTRGAFLSSRKDKLEKIQGKLAARTVFLLQHLPFTIETTFSSTSVIFYLKLLCVLHRVDPVKTLFIGRLT